MDVHFQCHTLETGGYKWIESLFLHGREGNRDAEFACRTDDDDPDERKAQLLLLRCSAKFVWKTTHASLRVRVKVKGKGFGRYSENLNHCKNSKFHSNVLTILGRTGISCLYLSFFLGIAGQSGETQLQKGGTGNPIPLRLAWY